MTILVQNEQENANAPAGFRLTGPRVLAMLLLFFGITTGANAIMITMALSSYPGKSDAHAYEEGLAWNRTLAAARAQDARQWRVDAQILRDNNGPAAAGLEVVARDAQGQSLAGLAVSVRLEAVGARGADQTIALTEQAPGQYRAQQAVPAGQWDMIITMARQGETLFVSRNRVHTDQGPIR